MDKFRIKDDYSERPQRSFDFKLFLQTLGFEPSKLDNLKYFRADGLNITLLPGSTRTVQLADTNRMKPRVATFSIPTGTEEALLLFKKLNIIKTIKR